MDDNTIVGAALLRADRNPAATAFMQKRHGIWQRHSWSQCARWIERCAFALDTEQRHRGQTVAIISGQRVEAVLAVYACQLAGLRPLLLHPTLAPGALASYLEEAGAFTLIAEDQEQVDKAADIASRVACLGRILVLDPKGTLGYRHVQVRPLEPLVEEAGRQTGFAAAMDGCKGTLDPDSAAVALYSGGVCADARLLSLSHRALGALASGARPKMPFDEEARLAAQLPLADSLGHFFTVVAPAISGVVPCFGEGRLLTLAEMREVMPQLVIAPARAFERLRREAIARIERAGGIRASLFNRAMRTGARGFLGWLIGKPLIASMGLTRANWIACTYDQLSGACGAFFNTLGKPIHGVYGLADAGGPVAMLPAGPEPLLDLFDTVMARQDAQAELVVGVVGAHHTQWSATGDLVGPVNGQYRLLGRASDRLMLINGESIQAGVIERELAVSAFVNQAVAVGGPASGITALIELDEIAVRDWARDRGMAFTTARSVAESVEVQQLAQAAVDVANRVLPEFARIRRCIVLPRPLDAGNGELTASQALRRAFVRNRYAHRLLQV